ncbi:hypothetical protein E8E12_001154 [Didymella heteroderae]|uniref:Uncharacterized protein n=1 Tax=Didymella heteroderae TaxID=1769908 RepID=A0A9P4WI87_9PLEO|nr:hypothetical protein E8E12_001154 [Didymella heteroderae]
MSTNTIGWDTPIGDYAGGRQVFLHRTGLLELRRPESAARIQETEEVADNDFRFYTFGLRHAGAGAQEVSRDSYYTYLN